MFTEQVKSVYEMMSPSELQKERLLRSIHAAATRTGRTSVAFHQQSKKIAFLPLVAIIILVLSSTALAVATWAGAIDWKGNVNRKHCLSQQLPPQRRKAIFFRQKRGQRKY